MDDLDITPVPEIDVKTKLAETKQHGRVSRNIRLMIS